MSNGNKIYTGLTAGIKLSNSSNNIEFLKGFELQLTQEIIEVNTLGESWKNKLPGIKTWSGSCDGVYSNDSSMTELMNTLTEEAINNEVDLYFILDTETIYSGKAIVSEIKINVKAEDKTEISFTFEGISKLIKNNSSM